MKIFVRIVLILLVVPAYELVAVFTGSSYYQTPPKSYDDLMTEYILPAISAGDGE